MMEEEVVCPHCKSKIMELYCNVTATCSGYINVLDDATSYDVDCLTDTVEMDDYCCPMCSELISRSEEGAKKFLNGKDN